MECSDFYEIADSYLGDELLVETNHEVLQHLDGCAACQREIAARRQLRAKLRAAFSGDASLAPRPEFAAQLHANLRMTALGKVQPRFFAGRFSAWAATAAVAASLLIAVGLYSIRPWTGNSTSTPSTIAATDRPAHVAGATQEIPEHQALPSPHVSLPQGEGSTAIVRRASFDLSEAAAGDHRDCAIKFRLAEHPIDLAEAGRKYDRAYIDLASAVKEQLAEMRGQFEFLEAHSCVFEGQRFAHIVVKHRGRVVSLLVAERAEDKTDSKAGQEALLDDVSRQVIACSSSGSYQVSCFETARHAIFVVSDLSEAENLAVARAFAPSMQAHISRAEQAA